VTSDDASVRVGSMVSETRSVSDLWFEIADTSHLKWNLAGDEVWESLRRRSMASDKDMICMSTDVLHHSLLPEGYIKTGKGWWTVDRASFQKAIGGPKNPKALTIFREMFDHEEAPDTLTVLSDEAHHALNAKLLNPPGGFIYESQQYSARVRIDLGSTRNEPLQVGRTSFVWPHSYASRWMYWDDQSWRPLMNGFVVSGELL
jgi:hypothetical protein